MIMIEKNCPGKQVQILYEPVAVRHSLSSIDLTESHISGQVIGVYLRRLINVVPSRNIRTVRSPYNDNCECRFTGEIMIEGD